MAYLHHVLIHFPIALSFAAAVYVVLSWMRPQGAWASSARLAAYFAAGGAIVSAATGLLSAGHVIESGVPAAVVAVHRNLALGATALLVLSAVLVRVGAGKGRDVLGKIGAGVGLVGAIVVTTAAHYGGDMLHPGMAPWSGEKHSHGPAGSAGRHDHAADDHGATIPASDASPARDDHRTHDTGDASAPFEGDASADAAAERPDASQNPPRAHTHGHGAHPH